MGKEKRKRKEGKRIMERAGRNEESGEERRGEKEKR